MADTGSPNGTGFTPGTGYLPAFIQEMNARERGHAAQAPRAGENTSDPVISWTPFEGDKLAYGKALRDATDLTATEHRMLSNLVTYTDADLGNAFPGHERLGRHMGYDGSSAAKQAGRVVRALEAKGYVLQTSSGSSVGVRRAATYRLGLPTPDA